MGKKPLNPMYPKTLTTWGDHIRACRLDRGLLQKDVARALGVDVITVTGWEKRGQTPRRGVLPKIRDFLGYNPTVAK
jgi:transcriptional regulator with XRE-family HTH domain